MKVRVKELSIIGLDYRGKNLSQTELDSVVSEIFTVTLGDQMVRH